MKAPETLLASIRKLVGKPYIETIPVTLLNIDACLEQLRKQFNQTQAIWLEEQQAILDTFSNKALLNGNQYRTKNVEKWLRLLATMMLSEDSLPDMFEGFERFLSINIAECLEKRAGFT